MRINTIYYIVPDLFNKQFIFRDFIRSIKKRQGMGYIKATLFGKPKVVGGIKVIYQHCELLRKMGYCATPLRMGKYAGEMIISGVPSVSIDDVGFNLKSNDVVVSTEFLPYQGLEFENAIKIIFVQSRIDTLNRLTEEDSNKGYLKLGYDFVIACGQYTKQVIEMRMQIPVDVITNAVGNDDYFYDDSKRCKGTILAVASKRKDVVSQIKRLIDKTDYSLRLVEGLTQQALIDEYHKADVFLASSYPEGFSLTPLEAMRCGCVVVGFTGGGASEFMVDDVTACVAPDGDCNELVRLVVALMSDVDKKERIRLTGYEESRRYNLCRMRDELASFYEKVERSLG